MADSSHRRYATVNYRQQPDGTWTAHIALPIQRPVRVISGPDLESTFDQAVTFLHTQPHGSTICIRHLWNGQRSEVLDLIALENLLANG